MRPLTKQPTAAGPRERLERLGARQLSDDELLAALLGPQPRGGDPLRLARGLISRHGSLAALLSVEPRELCARAGLGPAQATRMVAALELGRRALRETPASRPQIQSAADVHRLLCPELLGLTQECFWVLALGARHRLIHLELVARGSLTSVAVHPREVFRQLLRLGAAAAIVAHNHPSGDPTPSVEDLRLTDRLEQVGELTGIPVLDHVVMTPARYASVAELTGD